MIRLIIPFTETARVNQIIQRSGQSGMTELQFFAAELAEWKHSKRRRDQMKGELYYNGQQDILLRKRTVIGENGELREVDNLPNNRIVDNQYAKMVDQKTNYLVGKAFTVSCQNDSYAKLLSNVFGEQFHRVLKYTVEDALKSGVGWLYPYYDDSGALAFKHFPAYEILPFWKDDDHTVLDCAIRLYRQEVWDGYAKTIVERAEIFKPDGIYRYLFDGANLTPDVLAGEHENYFIAISGDEKGTELNWDRIPLVPFKANKQEIPLICRVKCLQDSINAILSDWENNMQEDARNTILVLTEYDGQDLGEFRRNLAQFGAVKVRSDGGVTTLTVEINAENYKAILDVFKTKLIENARGFDAKDDRLGNSPNQMNIQSMYSDIDLDANGMETEFQAAFDDLLWFINQDLANSGAGDFSGETATIVFNRDVLINESESIENCQKSTGILSRRTIVEQHPWTTDADEEMQRIEDEEQQSMDKAMEYSGAFRPVSADSGAGEPH